MLDPASSRAAEGRFPDEARAVLEKARKVNLDFASHLPNFVVDETAKRYTSAAFPLQWQAMDTVKSEVTFRGPVETRAHIVLDGKDWNHPFRQLPGLIWSTEYGSFIRPIFDPACPTTLASAGKGKVRGMDLFIFTFHAAAETCFGPFQSKYQLYYPARSGRLYVDGSNGQLMQMDIKWDSAPSAFSVLDEESEISWARVTVGNQSLVLPVSIDEMTRGASGWCWWVRMEETNHRQFEAASTITFN